MPFDGHLFTMPDAGLPWNANELGIPLVPGFEIPMRLRYPEHAMSVYFALVSRKKNLSSR